MNNSYYFQHDYSSRSDAKIQKLIYKEKFEGYGLYWALIEMLYINNGYLDLECERIAFDLHSDCDKIKRVIFDYDLFEIKDNLFFSHRILEQINFRKTKSDKAKRSANWRWKEKKASNANAMQTHSEGNAIKERKGKERKGKNNKENIKEKELPFLSDKFINTWNDYLTHRKQLKKPLTEMAIKKTLNKFKDWGENQSIKSIERSIENNWQGTFEIKEDKVKSIKDNLHYLN